MTYATVRFRRRGVELEATWRDGKIEADRTTKALLEDWSHRSRGMDTSGMAAPSVRKNHLTTIPSFLGLVRLHADEVLGVKTDNRQASGAGGPVVY